LINFVDATNDANHYTKPPPVMRLRPNSACTMFIYQRYCFMDLGAGHIKSHVQRIDAQDHWCLQRVISKTADYSVVNHVGFGAKPLTVVGYGKNRPRCPHYPTGPEDLGPLLTVICIVFNGWQIIKLCTCPLQPETVMC